MRRFRNWFVVTINHITNNPHTPRRDGTVDRPG